jgi:hypothetical protein
LSLEQAGHLLINHCGIEIPLTIRANYRAPNHAIFETIVRHRSTEPILRSLVLRRWDGEGLRMSLEMLVVGLCLVAAFGAVPVALLLHINALTWRSVRHVEAIEALAKSRMVDQPPAPPVERPARPQLYLVTTAPMHDGREPIRRAARPLRACSDAAAVARYGPAAG